MDEILFRLQVDSKELDLNYHRKRAKSALKSLIMEAVPEKMGVLEELGASSEMNAFSKGNNFAIDTITKQLEALFGEGGG